MAGDDASPREALGNAGKGGKGDACARRWREEGGGGGGGVVGTRRRNEGGLQRLLGEMKGGVGEEEAEKGLRALVRLCP